MRNIIISSSAALALSGCVGVSTLEDARPNVILILTDDQGIGNLGCLGNPHLSTPELDKIYAESARFDDFHVTPLSTPTRSGIITGRYPVRNGAWATFKGRDVIAHSTPTFAEIMREGGYTTALFGKWHLGDNYPSRATDCGFDHVVQHNSGGVGELSDYWGNSYFDDVYLVNNEPTQFEGYCTDVWFSQAEKFIDKATQGDKPFFIYLATNAAHSPHIAPEAETARHQKLVDEGIIRDAAYYGQITNLDQNIGRLERVLEEKGIKDNTILVFLTDNGAPPHNNPHTMGYRGAKGSTLEGGHRVPCFVRWNKGGISGGRDVQGLASHVDLLPTIASLCDVELDAEALKLDGIDLSHSLISSSPIDSTRTVFIHHRQDSKQPFDVNKSAIMRGKWRLLDGKRLYDIEADRAQQKNLAKQEPLVLESLLAANAKFIEETKGYEEYQKLVPSAVVDPKKQKVSVLTIQHAMGKGPGLWMPEQINKGIKNINSQHQIRIARDGSYNFALSRWPRECQGTMHGVPTNKTKQNFEYTAIKPSLTVLKINGERYEKPIKGTEKEVSFELDLKAGDYLIDTQFIEDGMPFGAYYVYIDSEIGIIE